MDLGKHLMILQNFQCYVEVFLWKTASKKGQIEVCPMYLNPIPLLLLNRWVGIILAPAFILLCKILTLCIIFEFYFRIKKNFL